MAQSHLNWTFIVNTECMWTKKTFRIRSVIQNFIHFFRFGLFPITFMVFHIFRTWLFNILSNFYLFFSSCSSTIYIYYYERSVQAHSTDQSHLSLHLHKSLLFKCLNFICSVFVCKCAHVNRNRSILFFLFSNSHQRFPFRCSRRFMFANELFFVFFIFLPYFSLANTLCRFKNAVRCPDSSVHFVWYVLGWCNRFWCVVVGQLLPPLANRQTLVCQKNVNNFIWNTTHFSVFDWYVVGFMPRRIK